uniref:malonyl CoA-acyl carrier protein transacylase n=1 Tax=Erigeron canadensis TaxID=72917 RepID=UPI001CB9CE62|nr:malonyl CoA-acyl carrier protein transacylase [Erigeron canadensis]
MLFSHHHNHINFSLSITRRLNPPQFLSPFLSSMAASSSSLILPSVSLNKQHTGFNSNLLRNSSSSSSSSVCFGGLKHGDRHHINKRGGVVTMMSTSVGSSSSISTKIDDALFNDYKPTNAFLFPGQGAQTVGMGQEALKVPAAAELYNKANEILGFDILDVCINGPKEKLDSTVLSQPAIYVTSLAAIEILRARDGGQQIIDSVDVTCGLSLGEYTALTFAGAFSFEDGLKLVKLRGQAMQEAADAAKGAMVSIIGLDSDKVQQLCDAANEEVEEAERVQIANFLCTGNYAVSGGVKGIEAVEAKAKSFKARMAVRLAVAGAFHTRFMNPALSQLESALAATHIQTPRIPVISNVDAQPHADPDTIKKILARQVTSPVQWETTVKTLLSRGLEKSYELGPGKVIAGIVKRMDKTSSIENISA